MDKIKALIPVVIVIAIIVGAVIFGGNVKSQNGYTSGKGDTLNVVEDKNDLAFDVRIENIERNFKFNATEGVFEKEYGPYTKFDIKITNNNKKELDVSQIEFKLRDENDEPIAILYNYPLGFNSTEANEITRKKIAEGQLETGSLYFANVEDLEELTKGELQVRVVYDRKKPSYAETYKMQIDDKVIK